MFSKIFNKFKQPNNQNKIDINLDLDNDAIPKFDKKYKTILKCNSLDFGLIDWANSNSKASVDGNISFNGYDFDLYLAFEDSDDALLFKIKYL